MRPPHPRVGPALREQLVVTSALDRRGPRRARRSGRRRASAARSCEMTSVVRSRIRSPSEAAQLGVEARGRLVEHEHRRVGQQRAGDRDPLALAAGQPAAALAELGVVAVRQRGDELVRVGGARRRLDLGRRLASGRAVARCCRARCRAARASPAAAAPRCARSEASSSSRRSCPSSRTTPRSGSPKRSSIRAIVDLPAPEAPTSATRSPGATAQRHAAQRRVVRRVAEPDVVELDRPADARQPERAVGHAWALVEQLDHALGARERLEHRVRRAS